MKIYFYHNNETKASQIETMIQERYDCKRIKKEMLRMKIKDILAGNECYAMDMDITESCDMFYLFYDVDHIQEIISFLNEKKINSPYKATVTKTNAEWTLLELMQEVKIEHEWMIYYSKLKELVLESMQLIKQNTNFNDVKEYAIASSQAYLLLEKKEQITIEELKESINKLEITKRKIMKS